MYDPTPLMPGAPLIESMRQTLCDIAGDDDPAFMLDVLASYQETTPALLAKLEAAHGTADAVTMGQLAHQLKSSSAMIGCLAFADQCAALEKACSEGNDAAQHALTEAIREAYPGVEAAVASLTHQLQRPSLPPVRPSGFGMGSV